MYIVVPTAGYANYYEYNKKDKSKTEEIIVS